MTKVREIKGTITLADGSVSEFMIGIDGVWQQWGATRERLSLSGEVMDALTFGLFDDGLMVSSDDPDDDDDDDDETGCQGHPDGPEMGVTFYCDGTCRDVAAG